MMTTDVINTVKRIYLLMIRMKNRSSECSEKDIWEII